MTICGADMGGIWLPDNGLVTYRELRCNRPTPCTGFHTYSDQRSGYIVTRASWEPTTVVDARGSVKDAEPR